MRSARIFIGSTGEMQKLAVVLQSLLEGEASARVWSQGVFERNHSNLDNLLRAVAEYDFACFLATPDDFTESRGTGSRSPRDNIVFEFGLFLGALGRDRVFFVFPRGVELKLPTDLAGVSFISYKPPDDDNPPVSVLAPVANEILTVMGRQGPRAAPAARRYTPVLEHGGVERIASLTDAALCFAEPRFGYHDEIRQHLLRGEVIPARYYYFTDEGAELWIGMSSDPQYRFHSDSMKLLRRVAQRFAQTVLSRCGGRAELDLVSLGSGDGEKDRLLLDALIKNGAHALNYYPIDISDKLLVACVKNVFTHNYDHRGLRTKAVIGDFCNLGVLRAVYEDRPSPNVFSILGNTLGNTDEARILSALKQSMYVGDFAIIEVNCGVGEVASHGSFMSSPRVLEYACLPLRVIGLPVSIDRARVRPKPDASVLRSAHSAETVYSEVELDGQRLKDVPLEYNHRYDFEAFEQELKDYIGVEVIDREVIGNAAAVLITKVHDSG